MSSEVAWHETVLKQLATQQKESPV